MGNARVPEQKVSEAEKNLARIAKEQLDLYKTTGRPLAAQQLAESRKFGDAGVKQSIVNQAVNTARESAPELTLQPGQKPSINLIRKAGLNRANITGRAANEGADAAEKLEFGKKLNAQASGMGISSLAQRGLTQAAGQGAAVEATKTLNRAYIDSANLSGIATIGGAALTGAYLKGLKPPVPTRAGQDILSYDTDYTQVPYRIGG